MMNGGSGGSGGGGGGGGIPPEEPGRKRTATHVAHQLAQGKEPVKLKKTASHAARNGFGQVSNPLPPPVAQQPPDIPPPEEPPAVVQQPSDMDPDEPGVMRTATHGKDVTKLKKTAGHLSHRGFKQDDPNQGDSTLGKNH